MNEELVEILINLIDRNEFSFTAFAMHPDVPDAIAEDFAAIFNLADGMLRDNPVVCAMAIRNVQIDY